MALNEFLDHVKVFRGESDKETRRHAKMGMEEIVRFVPKPEKLYFISLFLGPHKDIPAGKHVDEFIEAVRSYRNCISPEVVEDLRARFKPVGPEGFYLDVLSRFGQSNGK